MAKITIENLTPEQINAINSGIDVNKRIKYDNYDNQKQNALTSEQLRVVNLPISQEDVDKWNNGCKPLNEYDGYDPTKIQVLANVNGTFKWVTYIIPEV